MPKADFTYEVRGGTQGPVAIEDYVVRTADGESVGIVGSILELGGERMLVVERGSPGPRRERRAVPWEWVGQIDHDARAVWLQQAARRFDETAFELDPARAVEEGDGEAEAHRLSEPPQDLIPPPQTRVFAGVEDGRRLETLVGFFLTGFTTLAAAMVVAFTGDHPWVILFVVPVTLALLTGALAYRAYGDPYEPRGARTS